MHCVERHHQLRWQRWAPATPFNALFNKQTNKGGAGTTPVESLAFIALLKSLQASMPVRRNGHLC
jgi:hypothetical protein